MPGTSSLVIPTTTIISVRNQPFHFRPLLPLSSIPRYILDYSTHKASSKPCASTTSKLYLNTNASGKAIREYNMSKPTTSSSDHPALARMLAANAQWARDVEQSEPGFFERISKGQAPQVFVSFL